MIEDVFFREDIDKQENRINLAIFGLMCAKPFRIWLQKSLGLPANAVIYPRVNVEGFRPDFAVKDADTEAVLAWIEVECGTDQGQLERYRKRYPEPVLSIWGRKADGGDLSLEEIAVFLEHIESDDEPQVRWNAEHLRQQIIEVLDGRVGRTYKDAPVSAAVRATPFVAQLTKELGDKLTFDVDGPLRPGQIRANTKADLGFSLRVYSRKAARTHSLSVLNQTGGQPSIWFQSKAKMLHYLPERTEVIERLVATVRDMGGDMETIGFKSKTSVPIETALDYVRELAQATLALAH